MGRAKALLPWGGRPLIEHMVHRLGEVVDEVVAVSRNDLELPPLTARVVIDRAPDLGPLAGIREGLHAIDADVAFVTCTDSPFVDAEFVRELVAAGPTAAFEVDGRVQPFPAVYARDLASTADTLLDEGRARPLHLLEAADFTRLDGTAWATRGVFDGFNTPAEYIAAVARDGSEGTVLLELFGTSREAVGRPEVETGAGSLRDVLGSLEPELRLCEDDALSGHVLVSLNGEQFIDDLEIPIGPGERLVILEACAGG
jgi:molybdopterin-guanine dinucleotide biosynthesis protein A/molybdopterin converting factor small subunit